MANLHSWSEYLGAMTILAFFSTCFHSKSATPPEQLSNASMLFELTKFMIT